MPAAFFKQTATTNNAAVGDICSRDIVMTTPDEPLGTAIRSMAARDPGRILVVTPGTQTPIGMLSRIEVVRGYDTAVSRKIEEQHTIERLRLRTFTGVCVMEYVIGPSAPIGGKPIGDIQWPAERAVASIRRRERLVVPLGETVIRSGDAITFLTEPGHQTD